MAKGKTIGRSVPLLAVLMLFCTGLVAQQVDFQAGVPRMVEAGVPFRIEFTASLDNDVRPTGFSGPEIKGVNVIAGPTQSQGQSISIFNGRRSESYTYTYTYVLVAEQEGRITVPPAIIVVGDRKYTTKSVQIEAVSGGGNASAGAGGSAGSGGQQPRQSNRPQTQESTGFQRDDVLLRVVPSRTTVYKGEPVRLTVKIFTRRDIAMQNLKSPALTGFWAQDIEAAHDWQQEEYNGKLYNSLILREYLAFPQQSGKLTVEQFGMPVVARIVTQSSRMSEFEMFFGGGPQIQDIPLELSSNTLSITVKDWPAGAPAGFNGAVGQFKIEGGPTQTDIPANSSANYDIKISGSGNLPLMNAPVIEMPSSFEQYAVKTTDAYRAGGSNINGSKTFSTPFIPRAEGEYTIPPVELAYFDPSAERYVTLRTPNYTFRIGQDTGGGNTSSGLVSGINKEDLKILGEDIRFIRISDPKLRRQGSVFLFSGGYWLVLLLIAGVFAGAMAYLQKQIKLRNNKTLVRNKRAQKVALRRLKAAEKNMLQKNNAGFYDEMLKALWGYMADKLNIPVSSLSRDNVKEGLAAKGVEPELIDRYIAAIAECEYMQYAPSDKTQIGDVYNSAVELISKMESKI